MKKLICFLSMFMLISAIFLASIFINSLNENFYRAQYEQNGTPEVTGMSLEDLVLSSNTLLDYMMDYRDDMLIEAPVHGEMRAIFDERETLHMVDVKDLFQIALYTMYAFFGLAALGIIFVVATSKRASINILYTTYNAALGIFLVLAALMGAAFALNFNMFWTAFHLVLFSNDLWLLDPAVSIMINMFPLNFFLALCTRVLVMFLAVLAVLFVSLFIARKKVKKVRPR